MHAGYGMYPFDESKYYKWALRHAVILVGANGHFTCCASVVLSCNLQALHTASHAYRCINHMHNLLKG